MRLKEIKIDPQTMRLELDIMNMKNEVVIIGDGKAKVTHLPDFGETKIVTHQGKVKRVKWDEGEEF
nr:MAG TPA: hypothetical protein [Caudoviricetes sp.]